MPPKPLPTDLPIRPFAFAEQFRVFLETEHSSAPGIHLKLAKKSSGIPSISAAEAVEVALCYGWIDGQANSVDADWWLVRYTPRRAKSIWSKKNVNTVERLLKEGRMHEKGIAAVQAAKDDGRWDRAYAGPATIQVPSDLTQALADNSSAAAVFEGLNKTERYSVLWRIETASAQSRSSRIQALVQAIAVGKLPGSAFQDTGRKVQRQRKKPNTTKTQSIQNGITKREGLRPRNPI